MMCERPRSHEVRDGSVDRCRKIFPYARLRQALRSLVEPIDAPTRNELSPSLSVSPCGSPKPGGPFRGCPPRDVVQPEPDTAGLIRMSNATSLVISVREHPLLRIAPFITRFPAPLGEMETPGEILDLLRLDAAPPFTRDEAVRRAVRDLLRYGGHRPSGIGKPASEYLIRAVEEDSLRSINVAVDICNAVSLHSGFPVGVVDRELARPPYRIEIAPQGSRYVFNPSGQEMSLGGLICLYDEEGPCINPVRDAQRTKTRDETVETLTVVWAPVALENRLRDVEDWYRGMLADVGAETESVEVEVVPATEKG